MDEKLVKVTDHIMVDISALIETMAKFATIQKCIILSLVGVWALILFVTIRQHYMSKDINKLK